MMDYLPPPGQPYNLVQAWREAIAAGERLAYITVRGHFWQDLGTPENYLAAHRRLLAGASPRLARYFPGLTDPLIGPGARIGAGAQFGGGVCLGSGVVVGEGASLKNTVVWDRAAISPDVESGRLYCGVRGAGKRFRPGPDFGGMTALLTGACNRLMV